MKADEGLSKDAKLLLAMAAAKLAKEDRDLLLALRPALPAPEVEALYLKVRAEILAAKRTEAMRETARIRRLKKLLWENFGEELHGQDYIEKKD